MMHLLGSCLSDLVTVYVTQDNKCCFPLYVKAQLRYRHSYVTGVSPESGRSEMSQIV